jgi:hypothetical protein
MVSMKAIRAANNDISLVNLTKKKNTTYINNKKVYLLRQIDKFSVYSDIDENTRFNVGLATVFPSPLDEYVWPIISYWNFEDCSISNWETYLQNLSVKPCEKRLISSVTLANIQPSEEEYASEPSESDEEDLEYISNTDEEEIGEESDNEEVDDDDSPDLFL